METILLGLPVLTALGTLLVRSHRWVGRIHALGTLVLLGAAGMILRMVLSSGPLQAWREFLYIDALSGLMVLLVTPVLFIVLLGWFVPGPLQTLLTQASEIVAQKPEGSNL